MKSKVNKVDMKRIVFLFLLFSSGIFAKTYTFNVELSDRNEAPEFVRVMGVMQYAGTDPDEATFFANYVISDFYQTYPSSQRERLLNVFTFVTADADLMDDLLVAFPGKYITAKDKTDQVIELQAYYPNDYGSTSPVTNLGVAASLKPFDYVNAPKAWDYTTGNILIGISDAKIDSTDADFAGKTSFLPDYLSAGYTSLPFNAGNINTWHGTGVLQLAAAQGNNAHGTVGICMDCDVVANAYTTFYNGLLDLAIAGARVINMSWAFISDDFEYGYDPNEQEIIDELHEDYGVVLVAAAGNSNSYDDPDTFVYGFPASYNHVLGVTSVNSKNKDFDDELTLQPYGYVSWFNEDLISYTGLYDPSTSTYSTFYESHTTNELIDICAPGWQNFRYDQYLGLNQILYGDGTSGATPYVTGTAALMLSVNDCLTPDEVEDILKLTSKNIEANPANVPYIGRIGSGKLETGDAVEFTWEMSFAGGNALISGHDFYRFDFDLQNIMTGLTIEDQVFRDANTSFFRAGEYIDIGADSDFKPNSDGFMDLGIDSGVTECTGPSPRKATFQSTKEKTPAKNLYALYPNPNTGFFSVLAKTKHTGKSDLIVLDILGKEIHRLSFEGNSVDVRLPLLPSGMYLVKIVSGNRTETLKFIKE